LQVVLKGFKQFFYTLAEKLDFLIQLAENGQKCHQNPRKTKFANITKDIDFLQVCCYNT